MSDLNTRFTALLSQHLNLADQGFSSTARRSEFEDWDSLKHLEIMLALEAEFGIRFSTEELASLQEPEAILRALYDKLTLHQ